MPSLIGRITSIQLKNFKNVAEGTIKMPSVSVAPSDEFIGDILGIYGQNGSGKTAVIDALNVLRTLMCGFELNKDADRYIMFGSEDCTLTLGFSIRDRGIQYIGDYQVSLCRHKEFGVQVCHERIRAQKVQDGAIERKRTYIEHFANDEEQVFLPKKLVCSAIRDVGIKAVDLLVIKRLSLRERRSFVFNQEFIDVLRQEPIPEIARLECVTLLIGIRDYACFNLRVVEKDDSAIVERKVVVPYPLYPGSDRIVFDDQALDMKAVQVWPELLYHLIESWLGEMNRVLSAMIPGLTLGIHDFGKELTKEGAEARRFQLMSRRGDATIPLAYESDGINKLISILGLLIYAYNNESACLAVDELDAGVFEFLLGELLSVFEKGAKGQLIFTSHNLRPLEMINRRSIVFSTTNPHNRYIRLKGVQHNNNLRDLYLRSILIGGQEEEIYEETDSVGIARAFRKAGKVTQDEQEG